MEDYYTIKEGRKLRYGYTTGSCAAAAAKAAAAMLFLGEEITEVYLLTPKGISLFLTVLDITKEDNYVKCAVKKDAGDDPDVTDGILIYAAVTRESRLKAGQVELLGGVGVGRVTRPGLDQPVGSEAINSVPREMIEKEVREILHKSHAKEGAKVVIEVPEGEALAEKTFNPRLGIKGGISILGTTGIVVPMSEEALLSSIEAQIHMHLAEGESHLLITPGNYGQAFIREHTDFDYKKVIQCSNYVGKTLDLAAACGVSRITFAAHIGKFIKVAGGIMDTHSKSADCRSELMAACAIRAGADLRTAKAILDTSVTEEAVAILKKENILKPAMEIVAVRAQEHLCHRAGGKIAIDLILFSNREGKLAEVNADIKKEVSVKVLNR